MKNYLKLRINKKSIIISLSIGFILSGLQIISSTLPIIKYGNLFLESPYVKWLSIDTFHFSPVIFFLLLPLIASLPTANILKEDLESGLFIHIKQNSSLDKIILRYVLIAFIGGFVMIFIPLITNFLAYFLILPNIKPDFLINENLLVIGENTLLVDLFYQHPFIHVVLSIMLTSIWGGLFSTLNCSFSLWIKRPFWALLSSTIFQIIILLSNRLLKLPSLVSYVPSDFLSETSPDHINLKIVIIVTILTFSLNVFLLLIGRNRKIVW